MSEVHAGNVELESDWEWEWDWQSKWESESNARCCVSNYSYAQCGED